MMDWTIPSPGTCGRLTYVYEDANGDTVTAVAERAEAPVIEHESGYGALTDRVAASFRLFGNEDNGQYLLLTRTDGPTSKAAKAIYADRCEQGHVQNPTPWDRLSQSRRNYYRSQAQAALRAAGVL